MATPTQSPARPAGWPQGEAFEVEQAELWAQIAPEQAAAIRAAVDELTASGAAIRLTVGNLKGGVAKTTTAVYLALLLALTGDPVLVIDADPQNHSVLKWAEAAGDAWPSNVQVLPWATTDIPKRLRAMAGQFKHLIVDTSPSYPDLLRAALRTSSTFLITSQPNPMDVVQLHKSVDVATEVDGQKDDGDGVSAVIVLSRAKAKTNLLREARAFFDEQKPEPWPYFDTPIIERVSYAESFGSWPWDFADYVSLFGELVAYELDLDDVPGQVPAATPGSE